MNEPALGVIVPAAGASLRLGQPKQLLSVAGEPLVRRAIHIAAALRPQQLVVVTGAGQAQVTAKIEDLPVTIIHNPGWESGMGSSIAAGARALDHALDGVMVMLCDQWRVRREDLERLLAQWRQNTDRISVARWSEACGPPVIFPATLLSELRALDGDRGARAIIERERAVAQFVDIPHAGIDLDTPDDLLRLKREIS